MTIPWAPQWFSRGIAQVWAGIREAQSPDGAKIPGDKFAPGKLHTRTGPSPPLPHTEYSLIIQPSLPAPSPWNSQGPNDCDTAPEAPPAAPPAAAAFKTAFTPLPME